MMAPGREHTRHALYGILLLAFLVLFPVAFAQPSHGEDDRNYHVLGIVRKARAASQYFPGL
jgi:hypothetical protein